MANYIDVKAAPYNAAGNGTTDDTTAIQNAMNAGIRIYFPDGTYKITAPLEFRSQHELFGDLISGTRGTTIVAHGAFAAFESTNKTTANVRDVYIHDLTINNANTAMPSGSRAIDFTAVSYSHIERIAARFHEYAIYGSDDGAFGAYYNSVRDSELASCTIGIVLTDSGNAWNVEGGRLLGNTYGISIDTANTLAVRAVAIENNDSGIRLSNGATDNVITACHFEGNTNAGIEFAGTATNNIEIANCLSNDGDKVIDLSSGINLSWSMKPPSSNATISGFGAGVNLVPNSSMEIGRITDGSGNTFADGWTTDAAVPANMAFSLDNAHVKFGGTSQKFSITGSTGQRSLYLPVQVTPNLPYVATAWHYAGTANDWKFGIGTAAANGTYQSVTIATANEWHMERIYFVPTVSTIYVWIQNLNATTSTSMWLDAVKVEPGIIPTSYLEDTLAIRKKTIGANLASASTITVAYPIHHVTGTTTISTINAPTGFVGDVTLIADGAWSLTTGGNIAAAIGPVTTGRRYELTYDPVLALWYPD